MVISTQSQSKKDHYANIRRTLIIILVLNWFVAFAKIIYGLITQCTSMAADGFHSLSDGASNIAGLIGIHFACQPIDEDHPYGHKKYETLFSLVIAGLLIGVSINLFKEGFTRIYHPKTPQIDIISFLVMIITLAINIWVMRYEYNLGKKLSSDILVSDALHTKADIFTSFSVIAALIGIQLGFPLLDPIVTIVISLFIAHTAVHIIRHSSRVLCDMVAIIDTNKIVSIVLGIKGVKACHKIRNRGREDDVHLDLHVQVDPDMHIGEAHKISYEIEEAIKNNMPEVTDVLVHMEPKDGDEDKK